MELRILILILLSTPISAQDLVFEADLIDPESHLQLGRLLESIQPLDLNSADSVYLSESNLFSEDEVSRILNYRNEYGEFISIYELQGLGFDPGFIGKITPFLIIDQKGRESTNIKTEFLIRHSSRTKRTNNIVESSGQNLLRIRHSGKRISYSLLAENDKGETFQWSPRRKYYGTDFISGHLKLNVSATTELILGDFTLQTGEGLVFSSGLSLGKNAETILSLKKAFTGFKPYMSSGESGFFRGIALKTDLGKYKAQLFISRLNRDAVVSEEGFFRSFSTGGLHITESELSRRKTVGEMAMGMNLYRPLKRGEMGVNALIINWQFPKSPPHGIANTYRYSGSNPFIGSAYFNKSWKNTNHFHELALSSDGTGWVGGATVNLSSKTEWGIIGRIYTPDFHTEYGKGFGEYYQTTNEKGVYMGVSHRFSRSLKLSGYADMFSFPWLRSSVKIPS